MNSVELVRKLCKERKLPISRLERDLGYGNGYISQLRKGTLPTDRAIEIAEYLNIDLGTLMSGNEEPEKKEITLTAKDERDISRRLEQTLEDLESQQSALMFDGDPLDEETRELLKASLEHSIRVAKINAKKFTPKKYLDSGKQGK